MGNAPTIAAPGNSKSRPLPNWVQLLQLLIGLFGLLFSLYLSHDKLPRLNFTRHLGVTPAPDPHLIVLHVAQAAFVLAVILVQRWQLQEMAERLRQSGPIARKTFQQFSNSWMSVWFMWLILYGWLCVRVTLGSSDWLDGVTDLLDVSSSFAIWWCFLVLDRPSVNLQDKPQRDIPFRQAMQVAAAFGLVCAVLAIADRLFGLGHLGLACVGLYSGLALACFTGRLGSHYIGMPRWMLLFLYLYAMLQVFYSFFDRIPPQWTWGIFSSVLVLKVMFAFAGLDMLRYGGLDKYLNAAEHEFQME